MKRFCYQSVEVQAIILVKESCWQAKTEVRTVRVVSDDEDATPVFEGGRMATKDDKSGGNSEECFLVRVKDGVVTAVMKHPETVLSDGSERSFVQGEGHGVPSGSLNNDKRTVFVGTRIVGPGSASTMAFNGQNGTSASVPSDETSTNSADVSVAVDGGRVFWKHAKEQAIPIVSPLKVAPSYGEAVEKVKSRESKAAKGRVINTNSRGDVLPQKRACDDVEGSDRKIAGIPKVLNPYAKKRDVRKQVEGRNAVAGAKREGVEEGKDFSVGDITKGIDKDIRDLQTLASNLIQSGRNPSSRGCSDLKEKIVQEVNLVEKLQSALSTVRTVVTRMPRNIESRKTGRGVNGGSESGMTGKQENQEQQIVSGIVPNDKEEDLFASISDEVMNTVLDRCEKEYRSRDKTAMAAGNESAAGKESAKKTSIGQSKSLEISKRNRQVHEGGREEKEHNSGSQQCVGKTEKKQSSEGNTLSSNGTAAVWAESSGQGLVVEGRMRMRKGFTVMPNGETIPMTSFSFLREENSEDTKQNKTKDSNRKRKGTND
jgi:hypothetical protein